MEAVVAKAHGLPEMAALMAVTSEAASILGIADQTGTLAPGLDADIVIWEGRPISTWAVAQTVIVDGITHFDR
jgi:imidazolonepropionase-like amidohydrolase